MLWVDDMDIPEGANVVIEQGKIKIAGKMGEVERALPKSVSIKKNGNALEISGDTKAMINTFEAHIKNAFLGVTQGYKIKMKSIHAHFPISVEVKGKDIAIKNFLGEKQSRKTKIVGNTKMEVKGQELTLSGPDKDAIGSTISNIRTATKIRDKDGRVFQDGFYIVE